jgi:hypothetical protein
MTISNAAIGISTQLTDEEYYPLLAAKTASENIVNIGGTGDKIGFVGYKKGRTANACDWMTVWDSNTGNVYIGGNGDVPSPNYKLKVEGSILATSNAETKICAASTAGTVSLYSDSTSGKRGLAGSNSEEDYDYFLEINAENKVFLKGNADSATLLNPTESDSTGAKGTW